MPQPNQFSVESLAIGDNDFAGVDTFLGGNAYRVDKFRQAKMGKRGGIVYVDAVNGNNSIAVRGRADLPFLTIAAANAAAAAGDTVLVRPGTYVEGSVAKNGVNLHLMNGVTVDADSIVGLIVDDTAGAIAATITGHGILKGGSRLQQSGSNVHLEAVALTTSGSGSTLLIDAGTFYCKVRTLSSTNSSATSTINNFGTVIVEADVVSGAGVRCLRNSNDLTVVARHIECTGVSHTGVVIEAGATATLIRAATIRAGQTAPPGGPVSFAATSGRHIIDGARLVTISGNGVNAVNLTQSGLVLKNCTLVAGTSASSLSAGSAMTVQLWGVTLANRAATNVTVTDDSSPSRLVVSTAVS